MDAKKKVNFRNAADEISIIEVKKELAGEEALVSADMKIEGNIVTTSGMRILGEIVGDVLCGGNITLQGTIQGNVSARNLIIEKGSLTGDVTVQENVTLYQDAVVKGNIKVANLYSDGKTEGKIQAEGEVDLQKNAIVEGDLFAKCFSVVCGAKVKGTVNVHE